MGAPSCQGLRQGSAAGRKEPCTPREYSLVRARICLFNSAIPSVIDCLLIAGECCQSSDSSRSKGKSLRPRQLAGHGRFQSALRPPRTGCQHPADWLHWIKSFALQTSGTCSRIPFRDLLQERSASKSRVSTHTGEARAPDVNSLGTKPKGAPDYVARRSANALTRSLTAAASRLLCCRRKL